MTSYTRSHSLCPTWGAWDRMRLSLHLEKFMKESTVNIWGDNPWPIKHLDKDSIGQLWRKMQLSLSKITISARGSLMSPSNPRKICLASTMAIRLVGLGYFGTIPITPRPEKVDTWQPPRYLEWVLVSRNSFKGPQDIWYPSLLEKREPNLTYHVP